MSLISHKRSSLRRSRLRCPKCGECDLQIRESSIAYTFFDQFADDIDTGSINWFAVLACHMEALEAALAESDPTASYSHAAPSDDDKEGP